MSHLHQSLGSAAKLAVEHGNTLSDIIIERWGTTFRASSEDVRKAFEAAQTKASLTPNNFEEMDK